MPYDEGSDLPVGEGIDGPYDQTSEDEFAEPSDSLFDESLNGSAESDSAVGQAVGQDLREGPDPEQDAGQAEEAEEIDEAEGT